MSSRNYKWKYWVFSQEQLQRYRNSTNRNFIRGRMNSMEKDESRYLTAEEELILVRHYEYMLGEFFKQFMPNGEFLPDNVQGISFQLYKRFYLVTSVMDFHPRDIIFPCVYVACKICEYHVPIDTFVRNINGDQRLLKYVIVTHEIEVLARLKFRFNNIHTPHRAIDGLMIDIKARSGLQCPERLNEHIVEFMLNMWNTDMCLLYSPPVIALVTIMYAVSCCHENINDFVLNTVLENPPESTERGMTRLVQEMSATVMNPEIPDTYEVRRVESKVSKCRNPQNNPSSGVFKQKMRVYASD